MDLKSTIKQLWRESFPDSDAYVEMFFNNVFREGDALTLDLDGSVVSSLLLQPYRFAYHKSEGKMGYIAGASTRRQFRGRGFMTTLMTEAIEESRKRGYALCALLPASEALYYYYAKFGFATVFFVDPRRFTSLHAFENIEGNKLLTPPFSTKAVEALRRFEIERGSGVIHSARDFDNILLDLEFDNGFVAVVANQSDEITAMAFAIETENGVEVKEIFGTTPSEKESALYFIRQHYPEVPIVVNEFPSDSRIGANKHHGMARIIDVEWFLRTTAPLFGKRRCALRVSDDILPDNNHTFIVDRGNVEIDDNYDGHLDFDVDIATLALIFFSSERIGDVLSFPSQRASLNLMLE